MRITMMANVNHVTGFYPRNLTVDVPRPLADDFITRGVAFHSPNAEVTRDIGLLMQQARNGLNREVSVPPFAAAGDHTSAGHSHGVLDEAVDEDAPPTTLMDQVVDRVMRNRKIRKVKELIGEPEPEPEPKPRPEPEPPRFRGPRKRD